jgi:hypothetical protein
MVNINDLIGALPMTAVVIIGLGTVIYLVFYFKRLIEEQRDYKLAQKSNNTQVETINEVKK